VSSKILTGFKYIYLVAFFALLAGFFYPLITNTSFDSVIIGVLILFVGLAGGVLLYKAATSEKKREIFLGAGFTLMAISLYYIIAIAGRI
jgi:peptidoglycan/LPS O-acetylase OafA/YrhL